MIRISESTIETDRLLLRAWRMDDLMDFYSYASVPGVGEMAGWPHHENLETSRTILKRFIKEDWTYALVFKENPQVIGSLGVQHPWTEELAKYKNLEIRELGFVLAKEYWGQGLMMEACQAVLEVAFNKWKLDAVTCSHFATNHQSQRLIKKLGFKYKQTEFLNFRDGRPPVRTLNYMIDSDSYFLGS